MIKLIFILGALVGVLAGNVICVRCLRPEISADIGPQLRLLQLQVDNLETAINLALMTGYAELSAAPHPAAAILPAPPASSASPTGGQQR